jgi:hypothetical protein
MESLQVRQVTTAQAVQAMHAAGLRASLECDTPETIAAYGECFSLEADCGAAVFVIRRKGDVLWLDGAAQTRPGGQLLETGLHLAEEIARQCGAKEIAFETARPGLVRQSKKAGYTVAGYVMKRAVQ